MFLAITMVHLDSFTYATLAVRITTALRSISWLIVRLPTAAKDAMFLIVVSILNSHASTGELSVLKPITSQCSAKVAW